MDGGRKSQAEALVLRAARACGIQTRREDVRAALDDDEHGPLFAEWALLRLESETLLTADELQIYMELDKNGRVDELADSHDLAEVQSVTEEDLRLAIEQLRRSTDTINRHTTTLQLQQGALSRLATKQAEDAAGRLELEQVQRRKREMERTQLTREVEEITHHVGLRLAELEQQGPSLNDQVSRLLQSDDRLLSSLEKLGWELDQPDPDEARAVEKLRETCMRLIKTTVETVRARLDTVYLETLVAAETSGTVRPATADDVAELQEEVESLYSEILPVAQMSAEQQYLEPAVQSLAAKSRQSLGRTALSLRYVNESLTYLQERMARLHAHVESHKSYQAAARTMTATARTELALDAALPASTISQGQAPVSPVRARTASSDNVPLETLLRGLAVSLPPEGDHTPRERLSALSRTVTQRCRRCDDVAQEAQESMEMTTRAHLADVELAVQFLKDSLLAESPFADVRLVDPDIERSIVVMQQEVDRAKDKLRSLDGPTALTARSAKKDDFVERWSS